MNRRFFLRSLGALVAAVTVAPSVVLPPEPAGPISPFKRQGELFVPNPDWHNAEYECVILTCADMRALRDPFPYRFLSEADARRFVDSRWARGEIPFGASESKCLIEVKSRAKIVFEELTCG